MGQLVFQATLGGQVNLVGPNTASTYNINVPAVAGNMVTTGDTGTVTNTMCATSVYTAPGTIGSGTPNTGAFTTLSGSTSVTTPILKSASSLTFQSNGTTTAMTIDTSQNVGIGTSSPAQRLQVNGPTVTQTLYNTNAVANDDAAASIKTYSSATNFWNYLNFDASSYRLNTYGAERMRIDSSGNLLVGTTTTLGKVTVNYSPGNLTSPVFSSQNNSSASTNFALHLNFLNSGGTQVGYISASGAATFYGTSSDYRLKENVQPMTGALAKVAALKPVTYTWKADGSEGEGFIAHELQEICPHAVTGEKDAVDENGKPQYQGIDVSFLIGTLTAAIQEQQAIIEQLCADVETLKAPQ